MQEIPPVPVEVRVYDYTDINRSAQLSTKETFPWWWNRYGCRGTVWYPFDEPCRDLTK